jgi:DNA-binding MarR family transcriptional regulator
MPSKSRSALQAQERRPAGKRAGAAQRDPDALVGYRLRRVGALVIRRLGDVFGSAGLAPGQFSILVLIDRHPGSSQSDIARLARVDRSTLVPIIARLRRLELIARDENAADRRAFRVATTAKGKRAIRKVLPEAQRFERRLTRNLAAGEKARLLRSLAKIEAALSEED